MTAGHFALWALFIRGRHRDSKAKTFRSLFGYYPVGNIMSVHHCSFMSDNIVTFNEILTLLCHVPDSSASLQTMSNSLSEYYGARLKVPISILFFCHCHIGNVILLSLVTTLNGHQDSWDHRCWRHLTRLVTFLPHRLEMIYHISLACGEAVLFGSRVIHFRWSK